MGKQKDNTKELITGDFAKASADMYIKAMHLRFQGMKYKEIAPLVGRKEQRVRAWFMTGGVLHDRYEVFCKEALSLVKGIEIKSVAETIRDEAPNSIKKVAEIRDKKNVNPATQLMAAKDILDRAGYAPVQKTANVHIVEEMSGDELNKMFHTFVDAAKAKKAQTPTT